MRMLVLLCALLSSCTVIYVSGSGNTINESTTRGDLGITRAHDDPTLLERLRGLQSH